jgi:hypothetical protein
MVGAFEAEHEAGVAHEINNPLAGSPGTSAGVGFAFENATSTCAS